MTIYNIDKYNYTVCVIIRAYNSQKFIKKAIDSIINQTYRGKIMIVVLYDNGTTDDTLSILSSYKLDGTNRELVVISHPHTSASKSLFFLDKIENRCDYYTFLDYDNFFNPRYLQLILEAFIKDKCDFIFSNLQFVDESGNEIGQLLTMPKEMKLFPKEILRKNFVDMNSIVITKNTFMELLGILKSSVYKNYEWAHEDWILGVLGLNFYKWKYLNMTYINYCVHSENINYRNANKLFLLQKNINTRLIILQLMWRKITSMNKIYLAIALIFENLYLIINLIKFD